MATEFFAEGGSKVAITITPGDSGVLEVHAGGEKIFDKAVEGKHPDLTRVNMMRVVIIQKLAAMKQPPKP